MKLPTGENILVNKFSTGEITVETPVLTLLAKLTPRRSSVIRNREETNNKTSNSRERLPPLLATSKLP